ncbi:hypothetical protein [Alkalihalobacillus sp. BA299]|uniref:hypothetical protein n=1 Tax=Alkalihalobacillus sp. BA299 TaxID=2815938 RepID=UPI001AD9E11E|nr:hypothetical protein [Alkalihalobacillus sp. BA299]
MYLLFKHAIKKGKEAYHRSLYAYNLILYKDCRDNETKIKLYKKVIHHEKQLNKNLV